MQTPLKLSLQCKPEVSKVAAAMVETAFVSSGNPQTDFAERWIAGAQHHDGAAELLLGQWSQ